MNDNIETIECDDCHEVKPTAEFRSPGHTAGGTRNGFDIDSDVCAKCGQRADEAFQQELAEAALAEMAAEEKAAGVSAAKAYRQDIAPLVIGERWVYWIEQLQPDGSRRGFPLDFRKGVRAWRTDQSYIGDEQMTGMVTERRTRPAFRSAIVSVTTPTREQYDAWQAAHGQLVSARQ
jgi:hypothetical protein